MAAALRAERIASRAAATAHHAETAEIAPHAVAAVEAVVAAIAVVVEAIAEAKATPMEAARADANQVGQMSAYGPERSGPWRIRTKCGAGISGTQSTNKAPGN